MISSYILVTLRNTNSSNLITDLDFQSTTLLFQSYKLLLKCDQNNFEARVQNFLYQGVNKKT